MTLPPLWYFLKSAPKVYPPPLWNFQNFPTPPRNIAISYWREQIRVLFPRMPIFVSFMYFPLNSITHIKANSLCKLVMHSSHKQILWVLFMFWLSVQFYSRWGNSLGAQVMKKLLKKFMAKCKWNARSGRKFNCTFLSLCQEESNTWSISKEIRTSSRDKTLSIEFCSTKFTYLS